jgi:DNA end-binding protein Ku
MPRAAHAGAVIRNNSMDGQREANASKVALMAAARSVWKGFIRFSLVSVPVKAYTATSSSTGISLNQLHKECNSRINYKKVCPVHGELKADEIVSGYEYADGQYVVINPDELEKVRTPKDRAIDISAFIKPQAIDPAYYSGKTYYLVPDGPIGLKPYALLHKILIDEDRFAFAQVVFTGKEQVVLLRPIGGLIAMTPLSYSAEIKKASDFEPEVPKVEVSPDEMKLARTLTDAMASDDFDFSAFKDKYTERLQKLIEAKIAGKEVVAAPMEDAPQVINLMEALQKSVAAAAEKAGKPPKLVASSADVKTRETKKRKSS